VSAVAKLPNCRAVKTDHSFKEALLSYLLGIVHLYAEDNEPSSWKTVQNIVNICTQNSCNIEGVSHQGNDANSNKMENERKYE